MEITGVLVKELRELTGVGIVDCKKALVETKGDIKKAIEFLREKGLAAASKKSSRIAAEGLSYTYIDNKKGVGIIVEVNSETDFVAKNKEFINFVEDIAKQVVETKSNKIEDFLKEKWIKDNSLTVQDALSQKISIIGENITIRRFDKFIKDNNSILISYIHANGKVAVLTELNTLSKDEKVFECGKNISMQIAAMNPKFISKNNIDEEFISKEKEILTQQALSEGKPANIVEKIITGRLNKSLKEYCLLEQEYVKDSNMDINEYIKSISKELNCEISIKRFARFETGEGIEKKEENFAEEVNKAIKG